jgi:hypothetical protein
MEHCRQVDGQDRVPLVDRELLDRRDVLHPCSAEKQYLIRAIRDIVNAVMW